MTTDAPTISPDSYHTHHTATHTASSPSPDLCINSNPEDGPASPLPVETQLESCSSSSVAKLEQEEDSAMSPQDKIHFDYHQQVKPPASHWLQANGASTSTHTPDAEDRDREYHRVRLAQLREEGAARLRVLEAELTLHHQQRHMLQQQHQLKMQILMEKLKRVREGTPLND
ncbi:uncharacterized protein LOC121866428 [Homarus americanus]|nr:uncharacterized protein LOC121866428 [Homarus americanus]